MLKTLILSIVLLFHPVHVSLTSIDHVPGTDSLKVFVKMFYDDFLLDYKLFDGENESVKKMTTGQLFPAELMNKYLDKKVNISMNNKQLRGKLLNLTLEDNEISMNLVYKSDKRPKTISVKNMIMTGLYNDQANMTLIRVDDFEEGIKLTPEQTEQTFNLK
ncbi:MAG: hypothetical protein NTZ85_15450 [Bacteroidia bacterium]|nr:hypothetical protein [Bacteroidia bacterium]